MLRGEAFSVSKRGPEKMPSIRIADDQIKASNEPDTELLQVS